MTEFNGGFAGFMLHIGAIVAVGELPLGLNNIVY